MSLLPNTPYSTNDLPDGPQPFQLPSGVAYNITWTAGPEGSSTLLGQISDARVKAGMPLSCTLQPNSVGATAITDASSYWLVAAVPINGAINVYISAAGAGPSQNNNYGVSWAVTSN